MSDNWLRFPTRVESKYDEPTQQVGSETKLVRTTKTTNGSNRQVVVCGLGLVSLMVPVAEMHGRLHGGQLVSGLVRAVIITEGRCVRSACRPIREERVVIHNVQCVWVRKEGDSSGDYDVGRCVGRCLRAVPWRTLGSCWCAWLQDLALPLVAS